jgi:hypothetical protein
MGCIEVDPDGPREPSRRLAAVSAAEGVAQALGRFAERWDHSLGKLYELTGSTAIDRARPATATLGWTARSRRGSMSSAEVTYGTLPGESWVDPAAPRPPVGFRLLLPHAWTAANLDPATSYEWVRSYLRERVAAAPELGRHRGRVRRVLGELLQGCRAQGVFLLLLLLAGGAADRPEDVVGASLALAWRRLDGTGQVDVDGIAETLASTPAAPGEPVADRIVAVVELPTGPAAYLRTAQTVAVPGRPDRPRTTVLSQFLVPIPGLPWLGVVTAASANPELAEGLDAVADGVANSLRFLPTAGHRGAAAAADVARV